MADPRRDIKAELERLVQEGKRIHFVAQIREFKQDLEGEIEAARERADRLKQKKRKAYAEARLESLQDLAGAVAKNDFAEIYQRWYSRALPVIEQILPDRYVEFRELYRLDKRPRQLDVTTYTVSEYVQGTRVTRGHEPFKEEVFNAATVALTKFKSQIDILDSARARLSSRLADIAGVVEASLLDDETETAKELLKANYLRAAGVVAGVVLERHLKRLISNHQITFRKKGQIGNLNDALKGAGVYDVAQWRRVQRLGDIRNLCGHHAERDPTKDEVEELIAGVEKTTTTVF